jgi:hypothetical protein
MSFFINFLKGLICILSGHQFWENERSHLTLKNFYFRKLELNFFRIRVHQFWETEQFHFIFSNQFQKTGKWNAIF